jgi:hypothetical protein
MYVLSFTILESRQKKNWSWKEHRQSTGRHSCTHGTLCPKVCHEKLNSSDSITTVQPDLSLAEFFLFQKLEVTSIWCQFKWGWDTHTPHTRKTDAAAHAHFFKTVVGKNGHNVGIIFMQEGITVFWNRIMFNAVYLIGIVFHLGYILHASDLSAHDSIHVRAIGVFVSYVTSTG